MKQKYIKLGGVIAGMLSAVVFLAAASAQAAVPTFAQTSVTVGLGQSITVTSQNGSVYMLSNSAPTVVAVSVNGTQVTLTGTSLGSATIALCAVGTASDCTNLYVGAQSANASSSVISFSSNNITVGTGASQQITVSGGNGSYNLSSNSNTAAATATLSGNTVTVNGVAAGTASINVCDQLSVCGTLNVTISASGSTSGNQYVNFNPANPTVAAGQTLNVTLSPGYGPGTTITGYVILTNQTPSIAQTTINNTTLSITGLQAGTDMLSVCGTGSGCNSITVTVTGTAPATTATTPTVTTTATVTTPVVATTPAQTTTVANGSIIAAIQSLQSVMSQLVAQIQSLQTQLGQIVIQASGSGTGASVGSAVSGSSASGSYYFTEYLSVGTQDAEVTALQRQLIKLGFLSGSATGYFGTQTEAAVKAYQTAHGLTATGYVGPGTRAALNAGN